MKVTFRIPTSQFAFVEVVDELHATKEQVMEEFNAWERAYKDSVHVGEGLSDKDFCRVLDSYIQGNPMAPDEYYKMSAKQQGVIQEIKKCFKRINK